MPDRTPYTALIQEVADVYALPAPVLEAQILVESAGDPFALRYEPEFFVRYIRDNAHARGRAYGPLAACSYGLLQILYETALEIGFPGRPEGLFDPRTNLIWAGKHLASLVTWADGQLARALAAYNAGRGGWTSAEGQAYVDRVASLVRPAGKGLLT